MLAIMVDFEKKSNRSKRSNGSQIIDRREPESEMTCTKRFLYRFEGSKKGSGWIERLVLDSEEILQRTLKTAQEETKQIRLV